MQSLSSAAILRLAAVVVALVGLWFLVQSTNIGIAAANAILARQGGGMDTSQYLIILQASIERYRLLGAILLGVGAFRALQK